MSEESNQLKLKEELIKEELENKNYEKEIFLKFISEKKENGSDLNNWSIYELTNEIYSYKNSQNQGSNNDNISNIKQEEIPKSKISISETLKLNQQEKNIKEEINQVQNINIYNNYNNNQNNNVYAKEIVCKKLQKTELNDKEIIVKVQNPKISDNKYWEQKYIQYEVVTDSMKWLVYRRFSDFDNLRQILVKHYPRLFVPPIPRKKIR